MGKIIRVLVVDDSGYVISTVSKRLEAEHDIEVIGSARNGVQAIEMVKNLRPDVVTMDIIMPEMDGLTALKHIMAECPTPVVILSALTSANAETTIRALEFGAVDFFLKPSVIQPTGDNSNGSTLVAQVRMAAKLDVTRKEADVPGIAMLEKNRAPAGNGSFNKLLIIASSTGGPRALMQLVPKLSRDISAGILLVQHMPPMFTKSLSARLNLASEIQVTEAQDGDSVKKGVALMAPGDYHMTVGSNGRIRLNQDNPVLGVRPAADVTMKSVARVFRDNTLAVVLTGMGTDGTIGASFIKASGGKVLAQEASTCAVYGMPASVFNAGLTDKVLPLPEMANEIMQLCEI